VPRRCVTSRRAGITRRAPSCVWLRLPRQSPSPLSSRTRPLARFKMMAPQSQTSPPAIFFDNFAPCGKMFVCTPRGLRIEFVRRYGGGPSPRSSPPGSSSPRWADCKARQDCPHIPSTLFTPCLKPHCEPFAAVRIHSLNRFLLPTFRLRFCRAPRLPWRCPSRIVWLIGFRAVVSCPDRARRDGISRVPVIGGGDDPAVNVLAARPHTGIVCAPRLPCTSPRACPRHLVQRCSFAFLRRVVCPHRKPPAPSQSSRCQKILASGRHLVSPAPTKPSVIRLLARHPPRRPHGPQAGTPKSRSVPANARLYKMRRVVRCDDVI